eukprot:359434-Chlamydomonas_euryale.AAC.1
MSPCAPTHPCHHVHAVRPEAAWGFQRPTAFKNTHAHRVNVHMACRSQSDSVLQSLLGRRGPDCYGEVRVRMANPARLACRPLLCVQQGAFELLSV